MRMYGPIREVPVATLVDLVSAFLDQHNTEVLNFFSFLKTIKFDHCLNLLFF